MYAEDRSGSGYENYVRDYLHDSKKYKNVWLWPKIPASVRREYNFLCMDNGCDIVCKYNDNSFLFVQCKNYIGAISSKKLDSFTNFMENHIEHNGIKNKGVLLYTGKCYVKNNERFSVRNFEFDYTYESLNKNKKQYLLTKKMFEHMLTNIIFLGVNQQHKDNIHKTIIADDLEELQVIIPQIYVDCLRKDKNRCNNDLRYNNKITNIAELDKFLIQHNININIVHDVMEKHTIFPEIFIIDKLIYSFIKELIELHDDEIQLNISKHCLFETYNKTNVHREDNRFWLCRGIYNNLKNNMNIAIENYIEYVFNYDVKNYNDDETMLTNNFGEFIKSDYYMKMTEISFE